MTWTDDDERWARRRANRCGAYGCLDEDIYAAIRAGVERGRDQRMEQCQRDLAAALNDSDAETWGDLVAEAEAAYWQAYGDYP